MGWVDQAPWALLPRHQGGLAAVLDGWVRPPGGFVMVAGGIAHDSGVPRREAARCCTNGAAAWLHRCEKW